MFIVQGKKTNRQIGEWENCRRRGFTLLEIMLAVAILGVMSLAIFRFVQANMTALRVSSETAASDSQYDGLRDLLTLQWQSLSPTFAAPVRGSSLATRRVSSSWPCDCNLKTKRVIGSISAYYENRKTLLTLASVRKPGCH
ncbi:MAG: hypothetical protein DME65_05485 [Verrucomicrobia bacterium]|nr:MAG: hypothetical protein DME65_05485 [Verrucomicrobiota bacterium]